MKSAQNILAGRKGKAKARNGRAARLLIQILEEQPASAAAPEAATLIEQILSRFPKLRVAKLAKQKVGAWRDNNPSR